MGMMGHHDPRSEIRTSQAGSGQFNRAYPASLKGAYPSTGRLLLRRLAAFWRRLRGDSVGPRPS